MDGVDQPAPDYPTPPGLTSAFGNDHQAGGPGPATPAPDPHPPPAPVPREVLYPELNQEVNENSPIIASEVPPAGREPANTADHVIEDYADHPKLDEELGTKPNNQAYFIDPRYNKAILFTLFEIVLVIPLILLFWWIYGYLGGLDWSSTNKYKFNWHPIAMMIGMLFLFGNAAVAYRLFPFKLATNKKIHAVLNILAVLFIIFGLVAVIEYHLDWGYSNMYTLHSWLGALTAFLYIVLAIISAASFQDFDPRYMSEWRRTFKPWHIFLGVFLVFAAVITIITGIVEKSIFRVLSGYLVWESYSTEAILVNVMCASVVLVLLFIIFIIYTLPRVIIPKPEDRFMTCSEGGPSY